MKKIKIQKYSNQYYTRWNDLVENSDNGTLFQSLDFLSYHDNKFSDQENNLIFLKGEALIAVLPAIKINKKLVSPFGASFGGIVTAKKISLNESEQIIESFVNYLRSNDFESCTLILTPSHICKSLNGNLEYSLLRRGFRILSSDLFNAIELPKSYKEVWEEKYLSRNRNTIRKSSDNFEIIPNCSVQEFYSTLLEDKKRHNAKPTHSMNELKKLKGKYPDDIWFDVAVSGNKESVAICYFKLNQKAVMTFYMAQSDSALGKNGKNILVDFGIKNAIEKGFNIFDFGGSTIGYEIQNIGISRFKESFGALGGNRIKLEWRNE